MGPQSTTTIIQVQLSDIKEGRKEIMGLNFVNKLCSH